MWQPAHSTTAAASACGLAVSPSAAVGAASVYPAASASPLQAKHGQTSLSQQSVLERVIPNVRVLILQGLDARRKLAAVSRLSRAFRSLPALAFVHDSTADMLRPDCSGRDSIEAGSSRQLWALSLTVERAEQPGRSTLFTCPRSLSCIPHLATLETLHIRMERLRSLTARRRCAASCAACCVCRHCGG